MIESRVVIWFEKQWFDLENVWFDLDLIWNFMIWFEIIPNHKTFSMLSWYVVQCYCERTTTILFIEVREWGTNSDSFILVMQRDGATVTPRAPRGRLRNIRGIRGLGYWTSQGHRGAGRHARRELAVRSSCVKIVKIASARALCVCHSAV